MNDRLFWTLLPREAADVLSEKAEQENDRRRHEIICAGLPTSAILNVHRKRGSRTIRPTDFVREPRKPEDFMSPEEAIRYMDRWAAAHNDKAEA